MAPKSLAKSGAAKATKQSRKLPKSLVLILCLTWIPCGMAPAVYAESPSAAKTPPDPAQIENIKAYCLDFNWAPTGRRGRPFATPGQWAAADPAAERASAQVALRSLPFSRM